MHAYCGARSDAGNQSLELGDQRCQVLKPFAGGTQDCHGDVVLPERLLFGKIVVHRDQDIEVFLCGMEQGAVFQSFPAAVFHCFDLGRLEAEPESHREVLIEKYLQSVL